MSSSEALVKFIIFFILSFENESIYLTFRQVDLVSCDCNAFRVTSSSIFCNNFEHSISIDVEVDINFIALIGNFNFKLSNSVIIFDFLSVSLKYSD